MRSARAPPSTQVKLLRVLEQRELTRVGGAQPIKVDVRVVAATNRPLREEVESGELPRRSVLSTERPATSISRRCASGAKTFRCSCARSSRNSPRGTTVPSTASRPTRCRFSSDYPWPGNVRELRNLVESMVVLSPGHEITAADIPRQLREGGTARLLPVPVGPMLRGQEGASGRELEFIVRSLLELKLQVEELRQRVDDGRVVRDARLDGGRGAARGAICRASASALTTVGIEPREEQPAANVVTLSPGMRMADIERAAIIAALRGDPWKPKKSRRPAGDWGADAVSEVEGVRYSGNVSFCTISIR